MSALGSSTIATLLQMTYNSASHHMTTNLFMLLSLVLFLATAIMCQLANYSVISNRTPSKTQLARLRSAAVRGTPIIFFAGSIVFLFAGLITFAFTLFPSTIIPPITAAIVAVVLAAMILALYDLFKS